MCSSDLVSGHWGLRTQKLIVRSGLWLEQGRCCAPGSPLSLQSSVQVPELVFDVWCLSYNASVEPDLIPIFVFGHYSTAHIQLVSRRVVIIGNMVP